MKNSTLCWHIKAYFQDKLVQKVEVIVSYARNEAQHSSDLDITITPSKPLSLFQISGYRLALEKILGKK